MNIRPKLALIQLLVIIGFITALTVTFLSANSISALKDLQIQSERVLSATEQIKYRVEGIMSSNVDLFEQKNLIINSVNSFGLIFNRFRDPELIKILPSRYRENLIVLIDRWFDIYETFYLALFSQMDNVITDPQFGEITENAGSGLGYGSLQGLLSEGYVPDTLPELGRQIKEVSSESAAFIHDLESELELLDSYINMTILRGIVTAISVSVLTFGISLVIIIVFSLRLGSRIVQMRNAIRSVSLGDFSFEASIRSGDEFENFSDHYNIFKNELWEKLDSVLDFMVEISGSVSLESDLEKVLQVAVESAVRNTDADAGAVYLVDERDESMIKLQHLVGFLPPLFYVPDELTGEQSGLSDLVKNTPILVGETIIGRAIENGKNIFIRNVSLEDELEQNQNENSLLYISSIMVVPLIITGRVLGALVLVKNRAGELFTDIDFNHIRTFSDYAALTIDNIYNYRDLIEKSELHREIRVAADIQKNLLPANVPETAGLSFSAFTKAARGVSGDYYDIFRLDKTRTAVVICDVVGKGVPAALLMVMIRTIIRLSASPSRDSSQILTILNKAIIGRTEADQFATMSFIIYDEEKREIIYSNAAHAPMLHYKSRSRKFEDIDTSGLPIGIESREKYGQKVIKLEKDDILALYTDGITEARNSENMEYSRYSLQRVLLNSSHMNSDKIMELLVSDLEDFSEGMDQHDDQTLLLMKAV